MIPKQFVKKLICNIKFVGKMQHVYTKQQLKIIIKQAVRKPPIILFWIDIRKSRPSQLTDSSGRGQRRQRHGGVFVRFCGTVRCGECVIEVPQLIIVPLFGAGVSGAEEQQE